MASNLLLLVEPLNARRRLDQQTVTIPNRRWDAKIFQDES
jgi:hypothetical protein